HQHLGLELVTRGHADVGRHLEHFFEALLFVEALGEAETGPCDRGQCLAPAQQIVGGDRVGAVLRCAVAHAPRLASTASSSRLSTSSSSTGSPVASHRQNESTTSWPRVAMRAVRTSRPRFAIARVMRYSTPTPSGARTSTTV